MKYKRIIPCIFLSNGVAIRWFNDQTVLSRDVVALAKTYCEHGADELLIFDLSDGDEDHDRAIDMMRRINRAVQIPMVCCGNIRRLEDVKKILYAGAKRALINLAKPGAVDMIQEAALRFGKDKVGVTLNDFDKLFKLQHKINPNCSEIVFLHRLDLDSVMNITDIPCVIVTDATDESELFNILRSDGVKGLSGLYISHPNRDLHKFKEACEDEGIHLTTFEPLLQFSEFKLNKDGLLPVIVQHYKTQEVLMMAYMNEEAYKATLKSGRMNYYSRSRKMQWLKGETSGHYQYVKSLTIDCDKDTLLAKVDQVGAACHTGSPTCFFTPVMEAEESDKNPLQILESVYATIQDRKENPKEGSYTNYLFEKGIDKILKKVGEEATEIVIAAKNPNPEDVKYEISDFLYHMMVLMVERSVTWEDIVKELADR